MKMVRLRILIIGLLLTCSLTAVASQQDFDITSGDANTGTTMRAAINAALQALASSSSGATEPTVRYAYQFWADTTTGFLKIRNTGNTDWVQLFPLGAAFTSAATANAPVLRDSNGKLTGDITGTAADAGTLSGKTATTTKTADKIVLRDANGAAALDVTGNITGDVRGKVFGNLSGNSTGTHTGLVYGNGAYGSQSDVYVKNTSGTDSWTAPSGVVRVLVIMVGGSGGGGGANYDGSVSSATAGGAGGNTTFNSQTAYGGGGGGRSYFGSAGSGGAGGNGGGPLGSNGSAGAAGIYAGSGTPIYTSTIAGAGAVDGYQDINDGSWGTAVSGGSGGGPGTYHGYLNVTPGQTYSITVGAGGIAGNHGASNGTIHSNAVAGVVGYIRIYY